MNENTPLDRGLWGWRKSSYSQANGNSECVEVGWRTSSRSHPNGDCVELAPTLDALRDSKNPAGPVLPVRELPAFLRQLKAGRFDR